MKIISGGQTGIDQTALEIAKGLGFETGGFAPKNFITENGSEPVLLKSYGLIETNGGYPLRTQLNILEADITVIYTFESFRLLMSPGTRLTWDTCEIFSKPYLFNPTAEALELYIFTHQYEIINMAGPRKSKLGASGMVLFSGLIYSSLKLLK